MKFQKTLTALAVTSAFSVATSVSADVVITEYVEGGGFNKAIELYNTGDQAVDLTGYKLIRYKDGDQVDDIREMADLAGNTLPAKGILVVINSESSTPLPDGTNYIVSGSLQHNGGDAVALTFNDSDVDIVGPKGDSSWGKDVTLQRKPEQLTQSTTYDSANWIELPKDDISGLGSIDGTTAPAFSCDVSLEEKRVYEVQGEGSSSPLVPEGKYESDEEYVVRGVVSARGESLFRGFYIRDIEGDGNAATSDGIYVLTKTAPIADIQPGVTVCVQGKVKEYFNLTEIDAYNNTFEITGETTAPAPVAVTVNEGETLRDALERYEGMNVVLDAGNSLRVSRNFSYDFAARRNNMIMSHNGVRFNPTQLAPSMSDEAQAIADANKDNILYIESDYKAGDGEVPYFPDFNAETGYIRLNDQIVNFDGVISYSYGDYRFVTNDTLTAGDFIHNNDRDIEPVLEAGDLKIASFNLLNFFTTMIGGEDNPLSQNRGARSESDFYVQRDKLVSAISDMNADILAVVELENNGFGENSAVKYLVEQVNATFTDSNDHYAYVEITDADKNEGKYLGTDAIMSAILYRPSKVTKKGDAMVIRIPEQHLAEGELTRDDNGTPETSPSFAKFQRDSIAQTFSIADNHDITVVGNHFRSKGSSGCVEDWLKFEESSDPAHMQGRCMELRTSASLALHQALADVEGGVVMLGDFNSYSMEDPILALTEIPANYPSTRQISTASHTQAGGDTFQDAGTVISTGFGYVDLMAAKHGVNGYSYGFDGLVGSLDHAIANTTFADRVVDITEWNINSAESDLFEYISRFTGDLVKSNNAFSSSDHDPVILTLDLNEAPVVSAQSFDTTVEAGMFAGQLAATDADNDTLTFSVVGAAPAGVAVESTGAFTLDPNNAAYADMARGETRMINFDFTLSDGNKGEAASSATINLSKAPNNLPMVSAQAFDTTIEAGTFSAQLVATDADNDTLTFSIVGTAPAGITLETTGMFTLDTTDAAYADMARGETRMVSFDFMLNDGYNGEAQSTATISLSKAPNNAPTIEAASISVTSEGAAASGQFTAADTDSDTLTFSVVGETPTGLTFNADGSFSFNPAVSAYQHLRSGETETIVVTVQVTDGFEGSAESTLTITVTGDRSDTSSGSLLWLGMLAPLAALRRRRKS